jgi:hypothetical protein
MLKLYLTLACLAMGLLSTPALRAGTIDTFDFTEAGFFQFDAQTGTVGASEPGIALTGSFSGTVESDGLIEPDDLNSFQVFFTSDTFEVGSESLTNLTLFSFDTNGGASTLDFAGSSASPMNICMGAAVPFSPQCTSDFTIFYPAGTFSAVESDGVPATISMDQPQITLVSSITTNPTPEPRLTFLLTLGLVAGALVFHRIGKRGNVGL